MEKYAIGIPTFSSENKIQFQDFDDQNSSSGDETNIVEMIFTLTIQVSTDEAMNVLIHVKKVVDITKQRERSSAAINYPWHVNFNNRKGTVEIVRTSFENKHNHELNHKIVQTATCFRKLSKEMLEDIEFIHNLQRV
ncbi:19678_t:CDS:2 [Gigaspora margarita]|uniref:19678_t:CDS:1 n=1 Tax=Gigaspora margarita TaxID=4874 RepID=A0ABN7UG42_GIGMA|nr:19678_t:CDS:2 [Gigaspora margarita]